MVKLKKPKIVKRENLNGTVYYAIYDDKVEATRWSIEEAKKLFKKMKQKHIEVHPSIGFYKK